MITVTYFSPRRVWRQTLLVDTYHLHGVEPGGFVDQEPPAFGQDRAVGGVPGDGEGLGDAGDAQVLHDQRLQRPAKRPTGQLRAGLGRLAGVLAPHVTAPRAPIAAHRDLKDRRAPPERLVSEATDQAAARDALAAAAATPLISLHETTGQHRPVGLEALPNHHQAELVEAGERGRSYGLSSEAAAVFELAV